MEHKKSWLNRTRLFVTKLEDRVTPSTLNGLDLGDLALPENQPAIKRPKASEKMQIVNPALADVQQLTGPSKAGLSGPGTNQTAQVNQANNPAIHQPAATQQSFTTRANVKRAELNREATITPKVIQQDFGGHVMQAGNLNARAGVIGNGLNDGGAKAHNWAQFYGPGTDFQDQVNDNVYTASGVMIECGFQGQRGTMRAYAPGTGVLLASTNFAVTPASAERLSVVACAVNKSTIYAVLRKTGPGGLIETRVVAGPVTLGAESGFTQLVYPAGGGVVSLEDIAVDPISRNVAVTGVGDAGLGYDVILDFTYDMALTPIDDTLAWDFGVQTQGLTNAMNDTGERFIGGFLDDGIAQSPLWMNTKHVAGVPTFDWGWIATVDGAHTTDDANCVCSMAVNTTVEDGLFLAGGLDAPTLAPAEGTDTAAYQGLLISQDTQSAGGFTGPYAFWYYVNGGIGSGIAGHYYARGNAIAPDGAGGYDHLTVGSVDDLADTTVAGTQNNTYGDASHFDSAGGLPSFRSMGDANSSSTDGPEINRDTDGFGITTDGVDEVYYGGSTTAGEAASTNPFGGPFTTLPLTAGLDVGYGSGTAPGGQDQGTVSGNRDGYVIGEHIPLGS